MGFLVLAQYALELQQKCCGKEHGQCLLLTRTDPTPNLGFFVAKRLNPWFWKSVLVFRKVQPRWWNLSERDQGIGCCFIPALGSSALPSWNVCPSSGPCCTPSNFRHAVLGCVDGRAHSPLLPALLQPLQCQLWWWELTTLPFAYLGAFSIITTWICQVLLLSWTLPILSPF